MTERVTRAQQEHFAEEVGIVFERSGFPRIAGKIFGLLLISEQSHLSTDELSERLHASRGSISTMTRLLIQGGMIDKIRIPGQRHDSFIIKAENFAQLLRAKLDQVAEFHRITDRGFSLVSRKNTEVYNRLKQIHDFYSFFQNELKNIFDRWEQQQKREKFSSVL